MKNVILPIFVAFLSVVCGAVAAPEAGFYAGTVTVRRWLPADDLTSSYTLRVQARVREDGSMTILTTAPELPPAVTVEGATTRAVPVPVLTPKAEVGIRIPEDPVPIVGPIFPRHNYLVDDKFPALLSVKGKVVTLQYQNPAKPVLDVPGVANEKVVEIVPPLPQVSFTFVLRKSGMRK